jgi:hypothetical protein
MAAPLVGGPPGTVLHTVTEGLPSGVGGGIFPVEVMTIGARMVPSGAAAVIMGVVTGPGIVDDDGTAVGVIEGDAGVCITGGSAAGIAVTDGVGTTATVVGIAEELVGAADVVTAAEFGAVVPVVPAIDDEDVTGTAAVPGVICPVGVEQVTTVPGIVGSEASGTGASVVSGAPGWVVAENGLGPLSGEVTIVPGVDESPMAVVPMVETCASPA